MKFLIDESVEFAIVRFLRQIGHDIVAVCEGTSGITDEEVLASARNEKRILVTNDKDFWMLIYFQHMKHNGIVLLRLSDEDTQGKIEKVRLLLEQHGEKLTDAFVVVEKAAVRIRQTP